MEEVWPFNTAEGTQCKRKLAEEKNSLNERKGIQDVPHKLQQ
jgi:hypothetical protein